MEMTKRFVFIFMIFQLAIVTCHAVSGVIWCKQKQEFVKLFSVPQFAALQNETLANSRKIETHNFHQETLKGVYYQERNLVMFYDNDTKVTGFCGDSMELLAEYLNFTFIPLKYTKRDYGTLLENGSYSGLVGMIERNDAQVIIKSSLRPNYDNILIFTQPIRRSRFIIYLQPQWLSGNKWLFTLFSPLMFVTMIFFFILLSFVGYFLQKVPLGHENKPAEEDTTDFTLSDHIFYSYSVLCAQGYVPETFINKFKILSISKSIFSLLIYTAFSSYLIYCMSSRDMTLAFKNLETLINDTNYIILVLHGSYFHSLINTQATNNVNAKYKIPIERVHFTYSLEESFFEICNKYKYAMYETEDYVESPLSRSCELFGVNVLHQSWITFAFHKMNITHKKTIDNSIIKFYEVGLLSALKTRWLHKISMREPDDTFQIIDLYQVFFIFLIPCFGVLMSFVILVLEWIAYHHEQQSSR